jgi:hypothetical protein
VNSAPKSSASNTWRSSSSTLPPASLAGQRLIQSSASWREPTLDHREAGDQLLGLVNGPSTTVGLPFENFTRAPFALG